MKILVLGSKEYPMGSNVGDDPQPSGGDEIFIESLMREIIKRDKLFTFIIITRRFRNSRAYETREAIEIHRVSWLKGFYFRNLSFNIFSFFKALKLDFDVIFAQDLFATFFSIFLSKIKRKPLISVFHGTPSKQPQYPGIVRFLLGFIENLTFNQANFVIFLTSSEEYRGKLKNSQVIPMGLDTKRFDQIDGLKAKKDLRVEKDTIIISSVGRLIKVKGISYLIEALSKIDGSFICLIVGSGPEEEELMRLSEKFNLTQKIRFLGFRKDIPEILTATDVFVLPSMSEGLSISLLEAKAAGCASVVTKIGLPVVHRETALVVDPMDAVGLASAIEELIINEDLRKYLGKNSKRDVEDNYNWEKITNKYIEVFNNFKPI